MTKDEIIEKLIGTIKIIRFRLNFYDRTSVSSTRLLVEEALQWINHIYKEEDPK